MVQAAERQAGNLLENIRHNVTEWWRGRQEIARQLDELASLNGDMLNAFAQDVGISPGSLKDIIKRGVDGAVEMDTLMRALNIDPDAVRTEEPGLFRQMKVNCALCEEKGRCMHELTAETARENYTHFCINHQEMSELRAHPEFQAD